MSSLERLKSDRESLAELARAVEVEIVSGIETYEGPMWFLDEEGRERPVRFGVSAPTLAGTSIQAVSEEQLRYDVSRGEQNLRKGRGVIVAGFETEEEYFTGIASVQMACDDFDS